MSGPDEAASGEKLVIAVSAPSGSGKTSLCRRVVDSLSGITFSVSHTTRQPRAGETDGSNYFFVSPEKFQRLVAEGSMAEWTEIYGNCYGSAVSTIEGYFQQNLDILFDIDERGARQLQAVYPDLVTVLILPPSMQELKKRLAERGTESGEAVSGRLMRAEDELRRMTWYRYVVVNDRFEEAAAELKSIIVAERCRQRNGVIERLLDEPH